MARHRPLHMIALLFVVGSWVQGSADPIANSQIDSRQFLLDVQSAHGMREHRRITEEQFIEMSADPHTIVLDARSASRFAQLHIAKAKNLPFTDFTEAALAAVVPAKTTRVLIYCNNNMKNSPTAFPPKAVAASLNLSTFPALYSYGYRNVFELGPVIDPATSKIPFEGSLADR